MALGGASIVGLHVDHLGVAFASHVGCIPPGVCPWLGSEERWARSIVRGISLQGSF